MSEPLFLIKLHDGPATLFKKEALAQVLSCEFWEIFKKNIFDRAPLVAASELFQKIRKEQGLIL